MRITRTAAIRFAYQVENCNNGYKKYMDILTGENYVVNLANMDLLYWSVLLISNKGRG